MQFTLILLDDDKWHRTRTIGTNCGIPKVIAESRTVEVKNFGNGVMPQNKCPTCFPERSINPKATNSLENFQATIDGITDDPMSLVEYYALSYIQRICLQGVAWAQNSKRIGKEEREERISALEAMEKKAYQKIVDQGLCHVG